MTIVELVLIIFGFVVTSQCNDFSVPLRALISDCGFEGSQTLPDMAPHTALFVSLSFSLALMLFPLAWATMASIGGEDPPVLEHPLEDGDNLDGVNSYIRPPPPKTEVEKRIAAAKEEVARIHYKGDN